MLKTFLLLFCSLAATCQLPFVIKGGVYVGNSEGKAGVNFELDPIKGLSK